MFNALRFLNTYGKNGSFAEVSKNLIKYTFESNYVGPFK